MPLLYTRITLMRMSLYKRSHLEKDEDMALLLDILEPLLDNSHENVPLKDSHLDKDEDMALLLDILEPLLQPLVQGTHHIPGQGHSLTLMRMSL
jgi:hypothetical protein